MILLFITAGIALDNCNETAAIYRSSTHIDAAVYDVLFIVFDFAFFVCETSG